MLCFGGFACERPISSKFFIQAAISFSLSSIRQMIRPWLQTQCLSSTTASRSLEQEEEQTKSEIASSSPGYPSGILKASKLDLNSGLEVPCIDQMFRDCFLRQWRMFGKLGEVPESVKKVLVSLKDLERQLGVEFVFGGPRGKIQGPAGYVEDRKHRAVYKTLPDAEQKMQFFAARQVACRILGSKGYLCEDCWLPIENDCMCNNLEKGNLWKRIKLWVYMHPKDFLRKNNTGKLLWQVFGPQATRLCICGLKEQEDVMWNAFEEAGNSSVWCVYPEHSTYTQQVSELSLPKSFLEGDNGVYSGGDQGCLHFVLLDGTWSNAKAMLSRLQSRSMSVWEEGNLRCVTLTPTMHSAMHKMRPQPSKERTCTAAATANLLRELNLCDRLIGYNLDKSADAIDASIKCLLDALAARRNREGRLKFRLSEEDLDDFSD